MSMTGSSFKPAIKAVSLHKKDEALVTRHASTQPVNKLIGITSTSLWL
jgi:hypothetical protein